MSDIRYSMDSSIRGMSKQPYESVDSATAAAVAELVTEACMIVHDPKHVFLGDPSAPPLSDAVVAEMMTALQVQLDREGKSRTAPATNCFKHGGVHHEHWYNLAEQLPKARQRALAERIYVLYRQWADTGGTVPVYRADETVPARTWGQPIGYDYGGEA